MKRYIQNYILPSLGKGLGMGFLLCVLCVACTGDYDDWAQPQHNDQDDPVDVQMTVDVEAMADVIDIEALAEEPLVQMFVPVKVESNVDAEYVLTLSDDKGNKKEFSLVDECYVLKDELVQMINDFYGKKQVERVMNGVLTAEYTANGSTVRKSSEKFLVRILPAVPDMNYWIYGKQNNRDAEQKTLPLMPVSKENQTVTTYFSGKLDTKMWSDDTFGNSSEVYGAQGGNQSKTTWEFSVGGGYICSPSEGWYTLSFNFATYQYTFTKLENQEPTEYGSISLIGDFNEWKTDVTMTPVAVSGDKWKSHCWYALGVELTSGGLKFRADYDWAVSWGGVLNIKDNPYGVAQRVNDNLTVPAGTYNIYFNDITGEFLFIAE